MKFLDRYKGILFPSKRQCTCNSTTLNIWPATVVANYGSMQATQCSSYYLLCTKWSTYIHALLQDKQTLIIAIRKIYCCLQHILANSLVG